jgi:tetratricopeptide (TPR) repeat protein
MTVFCDLYDQEVTCASQAALDGYLDGVDAAMTLDRSGIPELERAIEHDPEFALAHVLLARQYLIYGHADRIARHVDLADLHKSNASQWEQSSVTVMSASLRHDQSALEMALAHARSNPRDVLVLLHIIGPFGLLAFSGRRDWREQNTQLVEDVRPHYSNDDWWMQATRGFTYAESGELDTAIAAAEQSWKLRETGNSAHSIAHALFERAEHDAGLRFLDEWDARLGPRSDLLHHMTWHRALLMLELGKSDDLLAYYSDSLANGGPNTPPLDTFADNVSLLWRLNLRGVEIPGDFWLATYALWQQYFEEPGFVFADLHSAVVQSQRTEAERDEFASSLPSTAIANCARAFAAFVDEDYETAVPMLEDAVDDALLFGGSNPQRRLLQETLDEAIVRSRQNA